MYYVKDEDSVVVWQNSPSRYLIANLNGPCNSYLESITKLIFNHEKKHLVEITNL